LPSETYELIAPLSQNPNYAIFASVTAYRNLRRA